jgi:hypothetical protein
MAKERRRHRARITARTTRPRPQQTVEDGGLGKITDGSLLDHVLDQEALHGLVLQGVNGCEDMQRPKEVRRRAEKTRL